MAVVGYIMLNRTCRNTNMTHTSDGCRQEMATGGLCVILSQPGVVYRHDRTHWYNKMNSSTNSDFMNDLQIVENDEFNIRSENAVYGPTLVQKCTCYRSELAWPGVKPRRGPVWTVQCTVAWCGCRRWSTSELCHCCLRRHSDSCWCCCLSVIEFSHPLMDILSRMLTAFVSLV